MNTSILMGKRVRLAMVENEVYGVSGLAAFTGVSSYICNRILRDDKSVKWSDLETVLSSLGYQLTAVESGND